MSNFKFVIEKDIHIIKKILNIIKNCIKNIYSSIMFAYAHSDSRR